MWHSKSKYNAVKREYQGRVYSSTKEANYAAELDLRKRAGEIRSYTPQYRLQLVVNGVKIGTYVVDFLVVLPNGKQELHEVKGYETDVWKLKWKVAQALYASTFTFVLVK